MSAVLQHLRSAAGALAAGDLAVAHRAASAALQLDPDSADACNLMGLIEFERGEKAYARAALERAVALKPDYANAWQNLAAVLDALGDARAAIEAERQALAMQRTTPFEPWYNLGVRAHRAGMLGCAGACFEQALKLAPTAEPALNNLAIVRDAEHRPYEARALAESLLALAPTSAQARHTFAAIWSKATEPADLARALEQALALLAADPAHAGAHECAAVVLAKAGDHARAIAHARESVRLAPDRIEYRRTLVRLLEEHGALEEAADVVQVALVRAPDDAPLHRLGGTIALKRGCAREADSALIRALERAPGDQAAIAQRGLALFVQGEPTAARLWLGLDRFLAAVPLAVPQPYTDAVAFNRALADDIRGHSRLRFEPVGLAAKGGYLTEDLLADRTPAILGFEQALRAAIDRYIASLSEDPSHPFLRHVPRRYRLNVWATRVAAQGVIDTHIHDESWLSGAYYAELPPGLGVDDDHAGWIEFGRPHRGLPPLPETELFVVRPEVGVLLLFPSYVYHRTLPFAGSGERISISFDLAEVL